MKLILLLLLIGASSASNYNDRMCGQDLTNLWLDVVVVADNSAGMSGDDMASIAANIASIFSLTKIGTLPNNPKTTRVGLVTYNSEATIQADLDKCQGTICFLNSLSTVTDVRTSNLEKGLAMASKMFQTSFENRTRTGYKRVVLVYTALYDNRFNSIETAERLKEYGVTISTIGYNHYPYFREKMGEVASRGLNFSSTDMNVVAEIQEALLNTNCFCPADFAQYGNSTYIYGVCIRPTPLNSVWRAAQLSCKNGMKNGYLLNEYTQQKHDFVFNLVKMFQGFSQPYQYHIGLQMSGGAWVWDQPVGQPTIPLGNWTDWPNGVVPTSAATGVWNTQKGDGVVWQNIGTYINGAGHVCEMAACDTDNYCNDDNF